MVRHIRIPWLVDLFVVADLRTIRELADHAALDRAFRKDGPLLNRILSRRVRRVLRLGGEPLPSARLRDDAERLRAQRDLSERFQPGHWDPAAVQALADHVRGAGGRPVGQLAQEVIGLSLVPDYRASAETWHAAGVLDDHINSWNPVRRLLRRLSGALAEAQRVLGKSVGGDTGGVHGTGIAVHNLVESLSRMRRAWADPAQRARMTPEAAACQAIAGPRRVLRAASRDTDTLAGPVRPTTLVALSTREAADRNLDTEIAFLSGSWSRCPADRWVMALLAEVWRQAGERAQ